MRRGLISPYWIIEFKDSKHKQLANCVLAEKGIETRDWWESGCHKESSFAAERCQLPNTDTLATHTLGLPMHSSLSAQDMTFVESALKEVK